MNRNFGSTPMMPLNVPRYCLAPERLKNADDITGVEHWLSQQYGIEFLYVGDTVEHGELVSVFEYNWGGTH